LPKKNSIDLRTECHEDLILRPFPKTPLEIQVFVEHLFNLFKKYSFPEQNKLFIELETRYSDYNYQALKPEYFKECLCKLQEKIINSIQHQNATINYQSNSMLTSEDKSIENFNFSGSKPSCKAMLMKKREVLNLEEKVAKFTTNTSSLVSYYDSNLRQNLHLPKNESNRRNSSFSEKAEKQLELNESVVSNGSISSPLASESGLFRRPDKSCCSRSGINANFSCTSNNKPNCPENYKTTNSHLLSQTSSINGMKKGYNLSPTIII
jgi:hypothetical protein